MSITPKNGEMSDRDKRAYEDFINDFARESDRAAVVLGAAKLDQQLYQILEKALIPNPGQTDELLDGDAPLSTFSARINMCYRLGLIDRALARALHLIRRIRNSFAHEISGSDLESGSHRDRVKELVAPFNGLEGYEAFKKGNREKWKFEEGTRLDFRIALAIVGARLEGLCYKSVSCYQETPRRLVSEQWEK